MQNNELSPIEQFYVKSKLMKSPQKQIIKQSLICSYKNPAHFICMHKPCQHTNAIMCDNKICQCYELHKKCLKIQIHNLINTIEDSAMQLKIIEDKINTIFDSFIDKLSQIQDKLVTKYRELFQKKVYTIREGQFLTNLQNGVYEDITGRKMYQLHEKLQDRQQINQPISWLLQNFDVLHQHWLNQMNTVGEYMESQLINIQNSQTIQIFNSSLILDTIKSKLSMVNMLPDIKSAQLLYRGSQSKFQNDNFHKSCKEKSNLLFLVNTKHGKTIGGFTPIQLPLTKKNQCLSDSTLKSFIFSITEGDKFKLTNSKQAIFNCGHGSDYLFGFGQDLMISNMANQNKNSFTRLSTSYIHQKYPDSVESYLRFTGSKSAFFQVQQIQVWKVNLS